FKTPYNAIQNFVRVIRDGLESARNIVTKSGLGGLFVKIVPPEAQMSIKAITGSIQSLGGSFIILMQALGPVAATLVGFGVRIGSLVLPVLSTLVRYIANFANAAIQMNPVVRLLASAIVGLLIANLAARALMFLWSVTRLGTVCAAVATAVKQLGTAIRFLYLVAAGNPVTGIIMVIAGALLYLALSSATVSQWLDTVAQKLGKLGGMDYASLLQPENGKSIDEQMAEFNKQLEGMDQDL